MAQKYVSKINKMALRESRLATANKGLKTRTYGDFDIDDIITSDVAKEITSALWADNTGTMTTFFTSSTQTSSAAGAYQFDIYKTDPATDTSASVQFNIAFGHYNGSGSVTSSGASAASMTPSRAVYTQFANLLLESGDDIFTIDGNDRKAMMFISVQRERLKERLNDNGWELKLDGTTYDTKLIDDSSLNTASSVNGSKVYNIVSGSLTDGVSGSDNSANIQYYGFMYPELGIIALECDKLQSRGGAAKLNFATASLADANNNKLFYNSIKGGASFKGRAEEDIASTHYFVRVKNSEYNFSNNPTFTTGSGVLYNTSMVGNPNVYITSVGLYNDENELVATAKLSKPLKKNFSRECTIRVKLDY